MRGGRLPADPFMCTFWRLFHPVAETCIVHTHVDNLKSSRSSTFRASQKGDADARSHTQAARKEKPKEPTEIPSLRRRKQ